MQDQLSEARAPGPWKRSHSDVCLQGQCAEGRRVIPGQLEELPPSYLPSASASSTALAVCETSRCSTFSPARAPLMHPHALLARCQGRIQAQEQWPGVPRGEGQALCQPLEASMGSEPLSKEAVLRVSFKPAQSHASLI